jgi:signal peptidase I
MRRGVIRPLLQTAAIAFIALTARASVADHYRVPTGSMEPTVQVGDRIVVNKAAYGLRIPFSERWLLRFSTPTRGEVVVLDPPKEDKSDNPTFVLLKRVVATAGDLVEVRDGHVVIDGKPTDVESANLDLGGGPDFGPIRVPKGKVLVLGDNRGNSRDGRIFGFIDREQVLGRAWAVVGRDGKPAFEKL